MKSSTHFARSQTFAGVRAMFAAAALMAAVPAAQATDYKVGDYDLTVNSTISVGSSWRVEGRDPRLTAASNGMGGVGASATTDDGNLNYNTGDRFSTVIKGIHELELKKGNDYGFFTRVKWFYDDALNNREVAKGHSPNGYIPNTELNDSRFHPYSRFDGINLLDAYGYKNTEVSGMPLSVRLGRQVIGWGESTLIFSPLSGINTLDLSALRRPGVDLKEAFTPSEHLFFNLGLNETTSLEAFYQLKWRKTVTEGCGTYFASNDISADGCNFVAVGALPDGPASLTTPGRGVFRSLDNQPNDGGQFGMALRKYVTDWGTEFGAYYTQYHSRLPVLSAIKQQAAGFAGQQFTAQYNLEYPEDIKVFGLSFATNVGSWAWSGEVTHSLDVPLQINTADLLLSVLSPAYANSYFRQRYDAAAFGAPVRGYDSFDVTQVQSSVIKQFDRVLGASRYIFLGEVGATFVSGLPQATSTAGLAGVSGARYGRSPVFGTSNGLLAAPDAVSSGGFVTDFAWGYRARLTGEYRDAVGSIDLFPQLSWSHDVEGWSPEPGQAFNEGRQALGVGLGFEFDSNTKASINYVKFMNSAAYDVFRDRDFISVSASYSF